MLFRILMIKMNYIERWSILVYLNKKSEDNRRIIYEYGSGENEFIGTIAFDIDNPEAELSERNVNLEFYDGYSFCRLTTSALQGIAKFIREKSFPDNYLRATH